MPKPNPLSRADAVFIALLFPGMAPIFLISPLREIWRDLSAKGKKRSPYALKDFEDGLTGLLMLLVGLGLVVGGLASAAVEALLPIKGDMVFVFFSAVPMGGLAGWTVGEFILGHAAAKAGNLNRNALAKSLVLHSCVSWAATVGCFFMYSYA
ncbi:MAG: hypothetical protein V9E81_13825 [Marmoricola sp.]